VPTIKPGYFEGTSRTGARHARMRAATLASPLPAKAPAVPDDGGNALFAAACQDPTNAARWKILADWLQDQGGAVLQHTHQQWLTVTTEGQRFRVRGAGASRTVAGGRLWMAMRDLSK
jgi:hypothetical protein